MPKWVYNDDTLLCMDSHLSKGNILWSPHSSPKTNYAFRSCNIYARHGDKLTMVLELLMLSESGGNMGVFRKSFFEAWSVTCWSQIKYFQLNMLHEKIKLLKNIVISITMSRLTHCNKYSILL